MIFPGAIVITGGSGGIGLNLLEYFFKKGLTEIYCLHRSKKEELYLLFKKYNLNPEKYCIYTELTDEKNVLEAKKKIISESGKVWGLINLAGASSSFMSWKLSKEEFLKIQDSNLLATFLVSKSFIPEMRENNSGRIVNITSVVAYTGVPGTSHYASAKGGIVSLTKVLSQELVNKNITVNALALGYFEYGLINDIPANVLEEFKSKIPMKRLGKANEIGGLISYLFGEDGGYCTGQVFHVNGGAY